MICIGKTKSRSEKIFRGKRRERAKYTSVTVYFAVPALVLIRSLSKHDEDGNKNLTNLHI